ncbi:MAG: ribonuclease D [Moraxellaceae bacterium]|nr:MAG: ribonuclease D [Moraxellaceae bacterium]
MVNDFQYSWIDSDSTLLAMIETLRNEPLLAVDTEFMRTDTFYPKVALIQIASPDNIYLVDPVSLTSLDALKSLFYSEQLEALVLHSCSEDLEVFKTLWQEVPGKIFDTQIAAAYLNLERQPSLQKLLMLLLDIDLPKDETRSNWLQRPLTDNQKRYAALDVAHLLTVYRTLSDRLEIAGRTEWVNEDCQILLKKYSASVDFDNIYRSVGSAWKLQSQQLAVLKLLAAWRDRTAMKKNRPKGHVLKDAVLYDVAEKMPKNVKDLARCDSLSVGQQKRFGSELIEMVLEACALDSSLHPAVLDKPFSRSHKVLSKKLKAVVERIAASVDVPAERLASRKLLERYAVEKLNGRAVPSELIGWRFDVLVTELDKVFDAHNESD